MEDSNRYLSGAIGSLSKSVMGLDLNLIPFSEAIYRLVSLLIDSKQKIPVKVAFINAHTTNLLWKDCELRQVITEFDYLFPDGIGMKIASYLHGIRSTNRISGTDLIPALLDAGELSGQRVFLLGDRPTAIENIAQHFSKRFTAVELVGYHHGFFDAADSKCVIDIINSSQPDILLVGMGTPIQEKWLSKYSNTLVVRVQIAVGGLFQYWDHRIKRAPLCARKMGLEWSCLLWQQPHKWKRYVLGNPLFLIRALQSSLRSTQQIQ